MSTTRWFLGVPFTPLTLREAASRIVERSPRAPFAYVTTPNAQHVVSVRRGEQRFISAHDRAWLVLNDSKILSLLSQRLFAQPLPTAAGSDLTAYLVRRVIKPSDMITIIGGTEEVESRLGTLFGMQNIARFNPPMGFYNDPAEVDRCVDFILAHPARFVFLAVGVPQSELIACSLIERGGGTGVGLCVGSSLHFVTGVVKRAPEIFRRSGLEWAYRLAQHPRRHARRVFVDSAPVLWIALSRRLAFGATGPHQRRSPS